MAIEDDLKSLAAEDVLYLSRFLHATGGMGVPGIQNLGSTEVLRGRLRQALSGDWVFNAATGQNGVVGLILGGVDGNWTSTETPAAGIQVVINRPVAEWPPVPPMMILQTVNESITLSSVIPVDFAD